MVETEHEAATDPSRQSEDRLAHHAPALSQPGALLAHRRAARGCRRNSARPLRGRAHRREHRGDRLRPEMRHGRHLRHDRLRQPRIRDRRRVPPPWRSGHHGRGASELHDEGSADALRRRVRRRGGTCHPEDPRRSRSRRDARHLSFRQAASDGWHPDATLRPREAAPLRQQDLRADLARLPSGLHLLRRAADERAEVPLPADRRGDVRGRQLRLTHDLHQRCRLLRHARAAEGGDARAEGTKCAVAGGRHLEARAGRPHAGAGGRERLHHAFDRLRVRSRATP